MRFLLTILLLLLAPAVHAADPSVAYANAQGNPAQPYREGSFGSGDTRLHYVEAGQGPLLLFVHGFPSFWFSWFDQMEALKGSYRVVAIDALGAGQSGKPQRLEPYRVEALAKQLDALARHLNGKRRFVLIGHDWGAALAFAYAQAYPRRLDGVIGLSAPPYNQFLDLVARNPEQQARSQYMQRFRTLALEDLKNGDLAPQIARQAYSGPVEKRALTAEEATLFAEKVGDPASLDGGMNWYRANIPEFSQIGKKWRWPREGARLQVPALLLWGQEDRTFVSEFPGEFEAANPGARIERIPNAGHWLLIEAPDRVNAALSKFLADIAASQ